MAVAYLVHKTIPTRTEYGMKLNENCYRTQNVVIDEQCKNTPLLLLSVVGQ